MLSTVDFADTTYWAQQAYVATAGFPDTQIIRLSSNDEEGNREITRLHLLSCSIPGAKLNQEFQGTPDEDIILVNDEILPCNQYYLSSNEDIAEWHGNEVAAAYKIDLIRPVYVGDRWVWMLNWHTNTLQERRSHMQKRESQQISDLETLNEEKILPDQYLPTDITELLNTEKLLLSRLLVVKSFITFLDDKVSAA